MGKKLELVLTVSLIVGALITSLSIIWQHLASHLEFYLDSTVLTYFVYAVTVLLLGVLVYLIFGLAKGVQILMYNFRKTSFIKVDYKQSQLHQDGYIFFKADLNVWLVSGFIKTRIKTSFEKTIEFFSYYDEDKKIGMLSGKFQKSISWKFDIPQEFHAGTYKISLELYDGSIMGIFSRIIELVLKKTYDVKINRWKSDASYIH